MKDDIIKTIMAIILAIISGVLVGVCDTFTVPSIAVTITLILCGIAGGALYRVCKIGVLRLYNNGKSKE